MTASRRTPMASRPTLEVTILDLMEAELCKIRVLIDYVEKIDLERHKAVEAKMQAAEKVLEHRLLGLNELRAGVITKTEYDAKHEVVRSELGAIREWQAEQKGKASQTAVIGAYALSGIGLLIGLLTLIYTIVR